MVISIYLLLQNYWIFNRYSVSVWRKYFLQDRCKNLRGFSFTSNRKLNNTTKGHLKRRYRSYPKHYKTIWNINILLEIRNIKWYKKTNTLLEMPYTRKIQEHSWARCVLLFFRNAAKVNQCVKLSEMSLQTLPQTVKLYLNWWVGCKY